MRNVSAHTRRQAVAALDGVYDRRQLARGGRI